MCGICVDVEANKMTRYEAISNLYEIKGEVGKDHAREVHDMITKDDSLELNYKHVAMLGIIEEFAGIGDEDTFVNKDTRFK